MSGLSAELAELTRHFQTRPGAAPTAADEFLAGLDGLPLPPDYLDFMRRSNGGYGPAGEDGLWIRLDPLEDVLPITRGQRAPDGLLLIGNTRLGDGLAIDGRHQPAQVVTVNLGWWGNFEVLDELGETLAGALRALEMLGPLPVPWADRSGPRPDIGFVPTPQTAVNAMLAAAEVRPGEMVYDLGCGDGRIIITAANKFYARGLGFDLDVELVQAARAAAAAAGVRHTVAFRRANIFEIDLSPADVVTLYLLREMNGRLLPQLQRLKPGARVVAYAFDVPGLPPPRSTTVLEVEPGVQGRIMVWQAPF
ncbi:MAG: methyltransferase domain-containing protein [Anaerolineales bacterium]